MNRIGITFISLCFCLISCDRSNKAGQMTRGFSNVPDTVVFAHWQEDPFVNQYIEVFVRNKILSQYNAYLKTVNINIIFEEEKNWDIAWVNGINYIQLKEKYGFYQGLMEDLKNDQYLDQNNPIINFDYQRPLEGDQCPWGLVYFQWIYNANFVYQPPSNFKDLLKFLEENPGRFTISNDFTGISLIKQWAIAEIEASGGNYLNIGEAELEMVLNKVFKALKENRKYLWKEGKEFPKSISEVHNLYSKGTLWLTYSYNANELYNKKSLGLFPSQSKNCSFNNQCLSNAHYLVMNKNTLNKSNAINTIDYMISFEAQYHKQKASVWGDGHVLDLSRLDIEDKSKMKNLIKYQEKQNNKKIDKIMEPPLYWEKVIQKKLTVFMDNG